MLYALPDFVLYPVVDDVTRKFAERISTGAFIPEAEAIKKAVGIPVWGVGYLEPPIAEEILKEGRVDMVSFGRRLMADPEFPKKLAEGRERILGPVSGPASAFISCL